MKENILLLSSEPASANFAVLLISIRASYPDSTIFYIFKSRNEEEYNKYNGFVDNDIHYITYRNYIEEKYNKTFRNSNRNVLKKLVDYLYTRFFSGLGLILNSKYEKLVIKESLNLIDQHNIKIVFSSNNPYQAHKAIYCISNKRSIIWNQFWLDPLFSKPTGRYLNFKDWCKCCIERKLFTNATRILVLPEARRFDPVVSKYRDKVYEIEIPYITDKTVSQSTSDIIFAGSFVKGLREPEPVFQILKESLLTLDDDIRFVFYVKDRKLYDSIEESTAGRIVFYDYVTREELDCILSKSAALLSIGNINSCQMPSKVVEYISYRKPILFFYVDPADPSFRYFNEYSSVCSFNLNDDIGLNVDKLVKFITTSHRYIDYKSLLEVSLFRKSTPEYIAKIICD